MNWINGGDYVEIEGVVTDIGAPAWIVKSSREIPVRFRAQFQQGGFDNLRQRVAAWAMRKGLRPAPSSPGIKPANASIPA
jgi:hypothetical protein